MNNIKSSTKISLFLHKENTRSFGECLKEEILERTTVYSTKSELGMEGKIFLHEENRQVPEWLVTLRKITNEEIKDQVNTSNKAVVVFKYGNRFFSLTYGHGKSMIKDSTIVKNFGLIVAAGLVDEKKVKSLKSLSVEDVVVASQKQAGGFIDQNQFKPNKQKDILKSIAGLPQNEKQSKFLVGSDSLQSTRYMNILEIKEDIAYFYDEYKRKRYRKRGFEWIDNIQQVSDANLLKMLNEKLAKEFLQGKDILIAPNQIIDWENYVGFKLTGCRKNKYSSQVEYSDYIAYIKKWFGKEKYEEKNSEILERIILKLKRDSIYAKDINDEEFPISNIFDGIIFEKTLNNKRYILCYGSWYQLDNNYYREIYDKICNLPKSGISFPKYRSGESEGEYNKRLATSQRNYYLLDKKNYRKKNLSPIEVCDVLTNDNQFIHVKLGKNSSVLSHLFSQGSVSAGLLSRDPEFRKHVNKCIGQTVLEVDNKVENAEIVYAILKKKKHSSSILPFFSMINLAQTVDRLEEIGYKCALDLIYY